MLSVHGGGKRRGEEGMSGASSSVLNLAMGLLAVNWLGGDHDKISADRPSGGPIAGRSYVCDGPIWSGEKSEPLWLLRLQ